MRQFSVGREPAGGLLLNERKNDVQLNKSTSLNVRSHFDAAHRLIGYGGDCSNLHGHRWEMIAVFIPTFCQEPTGISVDFKTLKKVMKGASPDHQYLNDMPELIGKNPTAENLVGVLFDRIKNIMNAYGIPAELASLELFESPDCSVTLRVA